jgi:UDP-N-acetylmuramoyl-tripeptide--D-alanyl-D-alanine ligase
MYFKVNNKYPAGLKLIGDWNIYNALSAIAVCNIAGVSVEEAIDLLSDFKAPEMRMQMLKKNGVKFLNDAYNSNPVSAINAITKFSRLSCDGRRILVLGDMLELGEKSSELHRQVGNVIRKMGNIDFVFCVGRASRVIYEILYPDFHVFHFEDVQKTVPVLWQIVRPGDLVLLKGSRKISLEKVLEG